MQVLTKCMSLYTNNHHYRQFTVNDLTEREPFSQYKFGRNIINQEKSKITNIIRDDTGMSNGQVITLSNFPFNFDMIFFYKYLTIIKSLKTSRGMNMNRI